MNQNKVAGLGLFTIVLLFIAAQSFYIVREIDRALLLQFGEVKSSTDRPGLYLKIPFIQNVVYIDRRLIPLQTPELEIADADQRRFAVDAVARWRVTDTTRFFQAVGGSIPAATSRLEPILSASVRKVIGSKPFSEVLSDRRVEVMRIIEEDAQPGAKQLGVELVDVRIRRADQPDDITNRTFERMKSDRQREATDLRARGDEEARKIRAEAENQAVVLRAEARRQSEIMRGQGDGNKNRILAEAYGKDPEFFAFYRSMQAYEQALKSKDTTYVLSPKSEFFRYFADPARAVR